jgi:hypothetical protein
MQNSTITEAIRIYGSGTLLPEHNNPTLFKRWLDDLDSLETQVMVKPGLDEERVEGKNIWTDGHQTWKHIRWPWKANTSEPEWKDYPIQFKLSEHLQAIGSTGWDWKRKVSRWVGYDFDSIIGHASGVGTDADSLYRISSSAPEYCEVVNSTSGQGRHVYIEFAEPYPETATHTEHAALARSLIPVMGQDGNFNFKSHMDVCGQVLWVYHTKANKDNHGFELVKSSSRLLTADDIPPNWRDNLVVTSGGRNRVLVKGWTPNGETRGDELDTMTNAEARVELDEVHHAFMRDLEDTGYSVVWVHDHHLLQTHTQGIKEVHSLWAEKGHPMKGPFETTAPGSDPGKPNCFMRPMLKGGWDVYRFGHGTEEHPLWSLRGEHTYCPLNQEVNLKQACTGAEGVECENTKDGFQFIGTEEANQALAYMGATIQWPEINDLQTREIWIASRNDRILVSIKRDRADQPRVFKGWEAKPSKWNKLLSTKVTKEQTDRDVLLEFDNRVRMTKVRDETDKGDSGGVADLWFLRDASDRWVVHKKDDISLALQADGLSTKQVARILGLSVHHAWESVIVPFAPEYLGDRKWNYGAPQLAIQPATLEQNDRPHHPHWDLILEHLGEELNPILPDLEWTKEWGVKTGGDYLKAWIAIMFREPFAKVPYLFFWGPQNCGKSIFHEAIELLVTKGVTPIDKAFTNPGDFNGELMHTLLGVIEEADIAAAGPKAYQKLKAWTTGLTVGINAKYKNIVTIKNYLHFVQMANTLSSLAVYGSDSRVTACKVSPLETIIGKNELLRRLLEEAPHFLRMLFDWNFPHNEPGRYRIPEVDTQSKRAVIEGNRDPLEEFIQERCYEIDGAITTLADFCEAFFKGLSAVEKHQYTKLAVRRQLNETFPIGRHSRNVVCVGNLSLTSDEEPSEPWLVQGDRLVRDSELEWSNE